MATILYTIGCPKCIVLEKKLNAKGIDFTTCTDTDIMKSKGIIHLPALEVNGKLLDFSAAVKWVNEKEG